jgi:hypothetical protein
VLRFLYFEGFLIQPVDARKIHVLYQLFGLRTKPFIVFLTLSPNYSEVLRYVPRNTCDSEGKATKEIGQETPATAIMID